MSDLLFDVPVWIPAILAMFGLVVLWNGNTRQNTRLRNAGGGLIVLAVAWFALSYFVDTDKEKAKKGTTQLVTMVARGDWDGFRGKLSPDVTFRVMGGNVYASGNDKVALFAAAGAKSIQLDSAAVQRSDAEQTGTIITVTTNIFSNQSANGYPPTMNSKFQFDWKLLGAGWQVSEIRLMEVGNVRDREIEDFMHAVR